MSGFFLRLIINSSGQGLTQFYLHLGFPAIGPGWRTRW
jgi:hypothetical protein